MLRCFNQRAMSKPIVVRFTAIETPGSIRYFIIATKNKTNHARE